MLQKDNNNFLNSELMERKHLKLEQRLQNEKMGNIRSDEGKEMKEESKKTRIAVGSRILLFFLKL